MSTGSSVGRASTLSSDEQRLDEVLIDGDDDFVASTLRLSSSPSPAVTLASAVRGNEQVSEEMLTPEEEVLYSPCSSPRQLRQEAAPSSQESAGRPSDQPRQTSFSSDRVPEEYRTFFSTRAGAFDAAVERCKEVLLPSDGVFHSAWLLTVIDHWDVERERIVLLTNGTLCVIKYDFIRLCAGDVRRVALSTPDRIVTGSLTYPPRSLTPRISGVAGGLVSVVRGCLLGRFSETMSQLKKYVPGTQQTAQTTTVSRHDMVDFQPRNRRIPGVRISWDCGQPLPLTQKWNPLARDVPYITLASHPLFYSRDGLTGSAGDVFSVEVFSAALVQLVTREQERPGCDSSRYCLHQHADIVVENYLGLLSLVHNAGEMGFFKARGKVSF